MKDKLTEQEKRNLELLFELAKQKVLLERMLESKK